MSTAKPTPGEWIADNLFVLDPSDAIIGQAQASTMAGPDSEARANAHLFAASKDMLAELEFAYAYLSNVQGGQSWKEGIERMARVIKKAKGEA
jgi:hypothetical protein